MPFFRYLVILFVLMIATTLCIAEDTHESPALREPYAPSFALPSIVDIEENQDVRDKSFFDAAAGESAQHSLQQSDPNCNDVQLFLNTQ